MGFRIMFGPDLLCKFAQYLSVLWIFPLFRVAPLLAKMPRPMHLWSEHPKQEDLHSQNPPSSPKHQNLVVRASEQGKNYSKKSLLVLSYCHQDKIFQMTNLGYHENLCYHVNSPAGGTLKSTSPVAPQKIFFRGRRIDFHFPSNHFCL